MLLIDQTWWAVNQREVDVWNSAHFFIFKSETLNSTLSEMAILGPVFLFSSLESQDKKKVEVAEKQPLNLKPRGHEAGKT